MSYPFSPPSLFFFFYENFSKQLSILSQGSNLWPFLILSPIWLFSSTFLLYWVGPFQEAVLFLTCPQTKLSSNSTLLEHHYGLPGVWGFHLCLPSAVLNSSPDLSPGSLVIPFAATRHPLNWRGEEGSHEKDPQHSEVSIWQTLLTPAPSPPTYAQKYARCWDTWIIGCNLWASMRTIKGNRPIGQGRLLY